MEKVWVYLSDKKLEGDLLKEINKQGQVFVQTWTAHDVPLSASFEILLDRFIVVKVDETQYNASGCSIDKLVRLIKQFETEYHLQLLNRLLVAFKTESGVEVVNASKIKELLVSKTISAKTLIYNVAVSNSDEFANWLQPLETTWLKKYL
jgi:hypothetical protein